jgi:KUP system potassium uptake protein
MYRIIVHYGFKQIPNVPNILDQSREQGVDLTGPETTFFLGRITLDVIDSQGMRYWRKMLFAWMVKNARDASMYFGIPSQQVVEIGSRLAI